MRGVFTLGLLALCALASGCASVAGGNVQKMYVQAHAADGSAVDGADCTLSNDKGTWRMRSPGDSSVVRSNKPMEVKCDKAPLPSGLVSVESGTRAAMFGNIIIGGVVGAVIDHSSGAAYEYPEQVRVVMGRMSSLPFVHGGGMPPPPPTGFAALHDAAALPHVSQKAKDSYREWTTRANPKAFAIAPNGHWWMSNGTTPSDKSLPTDPLARALEGCERSAKVKCKLYAVNDNVVWVKDAPVAAVTATPVATPVAAATAVPAAALVPVSAPPQPARIASGYAAIDDVDALPYLSDKGREEYRVWLTRPTPKAFAISTTGQWANAWSLTPTDTSLPSDPGERALTVCERRAKMPCKLYAVNGSVVWARDPR